MLARPEFRHAPILVAGANFGSGSSREHAPWALQDWGYRAVIAPSYADIFRSNCAKVGLLCVVLPDDAWPSCSAAAPAEATSTSSAQHGDARRRAAWCRSRSTRARARTC